MVFIVAFSLFALSHACDVATNGVWKVQDGDSLSKAAAALSIKADAILDLNPNMRANMTIYPGQSWNVPPMQSAVSPATWITGTVTQDGSTLCTPYLYLHQPTAGTGTAGSASATSTRMTKERKQLRSASGIACNVNSVNVAGGTHPDELKFTSKTFCEMERDLLNTTNPTFIRAIQTHNEVFQWHLHSLTWNSWNATCNELTEARDDKKCVKIMNDAFSKCK